MGWRGRAGSRSLASGQVNFENLFLPQKFKPVTFSPSGKRSG